MGRSLTHRQRRFVNEYLIDLNATQACLRAGYSARNAGKIGAELLGKTSISAAIQEAQRNREKASEITQHRVLIELGRIAFSDITDFMSWNGEEITLKDSSTFTKDQSACVAEVKRGGIRLYDKIRALEKLGDHFGMFQKAENVDSAKIADEIRKFLFESDEMYDRNSTYATMATT